MTDRTLREHLDRLVADEPPLKLTLDPVVASGRQLRRRHRMTVAVGTAVAVAAAAAVAVPLLATRGSSTNDRLVVSPLAVTRAQAHPTTATDEPLTARQQAIVDAIEGASPAGWTFDFSADRWEPDNMGVEATADDGAGPGQLTIGISPSTQLLHPCADPEFKAGVTCEERTLSDGSVLSSRAAVEANGVRYTDIVLTHPDGSGVLAESSNFLITWPLPAVMTPEQKRDLVHVSRTDPPYTPQQLAKVALAVNAVISG